MFQHELFIGDILFYLHYRITYIKSLLKQNYDDHLTLINTSDYALEMSLIHWDYPTDYNNKYPLDCTPVIAVQFPSSNANYQIIDGNHRIAKYIDIKSSYVPSYLFNIDDVVNHKFLFMSFDLVIYLFWNDVNYLIYEKVNNHVSDKYLEDISLFKTAYELINQTLIL